MILINFGFGYTWLYFASLVFTGCLVTTQWVPGHHTCLYINEHYSVQCTVYCTLHCTPYYTINCTHTSKWLADLTFSLRINPSLPPVNCTWNHTVHSTEHCTVHFTVHYIVHCTVHYTLHYTLHKHQSGVLIWPYSRGTLSILPLVNFCWTLLCTTVHYTEHCTVQHS